MKESLMADAGVDAQRVVDLLYDCLVSYAEAVGGDAERYMAAISELRALPVIPGELPHDSRFPDNMNASPPVKRVADTLYDGGTLLVEIRDYRRAIPLLRRVIELDPSDADAHRELGVALLCLDNPLGALEQLLEYRALAPDKPEGYYGAGDCLVLVGRVDEALEAYREARNVAPDDPAVLKRCRHFEL